MTVLIRDLLDIPNQVHKGDFVLRLTEGVAHPHQTLGNYVVTPELKTRFEEALQFIQSAVESGSSKATYLHGSFGAGKSHFMAVLHLLLQDVPEARTLPELAPVVTRFDWLGQRRFLLVPYHMVGAKNMESAILGGYVEHVRRVHPDAPIPAVYLCEKLFENASAMRATMGDAAFFEKLGTGSGEGGWGELESGWDAESFQAALAAPPDSEEAVRLLEDLLTHIFPAYSDLAGGKGLGFLPLDAGLARISQHAKALGYDALILFLDELILWLASRAADLDFVHQEGQKLTKLVEAQHANRPVPIISFVARQRDLTELVGDTITGAEQLRFSDALKHWEGRFHKITLEDRNLPEIASRRVLRPRSDEARRTLKESFDKVLGLREEVLATLLTEHATEEMFRKVYPFSPALVEVLVAVSSALQRERTALKIMMELLVGQRDTLELGQLIPVGDLFDLLVSGDEAFTDVMRSLAENARRLYREKMLPLLEGEYGGTLEDLRLEAHQDAEAARRLRQFQADDRLVKTLLLSALTPEVPSMKALTPARLSALNHGSIQAPIPGFEKTVVLNKLKHWIASGVGEIKLSEDALNPTVSMQLTGVDVEGIIERARSEDNHGNRVRKVRELLFNALQMPLEETLFQSYRLLWRGSAHNFEVLYANVRDLPDESLRSRGEEWKVVLDYPFDPGFSPNDDLARLESFREMNLEGSNTLVWLPTFLSSRAGKDLGTLVILDYILSGERFGSHASHLAPSDREVARQLLQNRREILRHRCLEALEMAYGIRQPSGSLVDDSFQMQLSDHFQSLHCAFRPQPPARSGSLKDALEGLLDQALRAWYPACPVFEVKEEIRLARVRKIWAELQQALEKRDGRHLVEDKSLRILLREVAQPLKLGTMYEDHFLVDRHWMLHFHKKIAEHSPAHLTVKALFEWMDQPERMGLPDLLRALVVLFFATQTNRSFKRHGGQVLPDLDSLQADMELVEQALPAEEDWRRAVERARKVFDLKPLEVLNAANVGRLAESVQQEAAALGSAASALPQHLQELAGVVGAGADTARLGTARAAASLCSTLTAKGLESQDLVWRLATADLAAGPELVRASLKSAADLVEALGKRNLQLLRAAAAWTDGNRERGRELLEAVNRVLVVEELGKPLAPEVRRAAESVFQILTVKPPPAPTLPEVPPPAEVKPSVDVLSSGSFSRLRPQEARQRLEEVRLAVEEAGDQVEVELSWTLRRRG